MKHGSPGTARRGEAPSDRRNLYSVALVGRPNVGKSALFNRLSGTRKALVHDRPGMTRDSLGAEIATDDGRRFRLVDTGGLDLDAAGGFEAWTSEKAMAAVTDADLLVFVLDGAAGLLPEDQRIGARLHSLGKPVVVAWNKTDRRDAAESVGEASRLGFDEVFPVSAIHGGGSEELLEEIERRLPPDLDATTRVEPLRIAIVGRPNVGKSSLVNKLIGTEAVMVSEIPGTTRNPVDVPFEKAGKSYLLVDTAGIRRKGKTTDSAELLSVSAARRSLERATVAILVFDAGEGITSQDATIAGYAEEAGCGIVLVANKWDLVEGDRQRIDALRTEAAHRFVFVRPSGLLQVSALSGRNVLRILAEADAVAERYATRFPTGELNRVLKIACERQTARGKSGRDLKIRYAVQIASAPPLVRLFADRDEKLHFSFERYLQNRIREKWPLDGVPLKFVVRGGD